MDTLSLGYLSLPGASAQQLVQAAQAARLRRVGLRIAGRKPADAGDWVLGRAERLRDLRIALVDTATEVLSVAAYYVDAHTTVADFLPVFETAALLGA
ncbi:MAG: hypothetical protein JWP29_3199, partial [Rhodoferax sp.]|nr:hypothetical protein [Rhodoferax sp.]